MAGAGDRPWRAVAGALLASVRLTPRGGRDAIEGVEQLSDGRAVVRARVRAVPEDGRANAALCRLVAEACGVPARAVAVESGGTSRLKVLRIDGDPDALSRRLHAVTEGAGR